jgi:hypothetical protein
MAKVRMVLVNGELDGWDREVSCSDIPQVFYGVPAYEEKRITDTRGTDAKQALRDKLATLAYKYSPTLSTPECFKLVRAPELDKVVKS